MNISLSNIIRTRLGGCLIVPGILLFIDGRQPICFRKASLSQPSNPRRSEISEVWGCPKARRRFADGLCALQKAATQHWGVPTPQKRVRIMLLRLTIAKEWPIRNRRTGHNGSIVSHFQYFLCFFLYCVGVMPVAPRKKAVKLALVL